jgi:predicted amino acid dehydrogenase
MIVESNLLVPRACYLFSHRPAPESPTSVRQLISASAALQGMQTELKKVVVVGATGSIGGACVRWFASKGYALVMVAPKFEKLKMLKSVIEQDTAGGAQLEIALKADMYAPECQAIITTTTTLLVSVSWMLVPCHLVP